MDFELFEQTIWDNGYALVACNHYGIKDKRHIYCVVMDREGSEAFMAQGPDSSQVFRELVFKVKGVF